MTDALADAEAAVASAEAVVDGAVGRLARLASVDGRLVADRLDDHQVVAYDLAHAAAALAASRVMVDYGARGEAESLLARVFVGDAVAEVAARLEGRHADWGTDGGGLRPAHAFLASARAPAFLASVADAVDAVGTGPQHLDDDLALVATTFRRFADERIRPVAGAVHRDDADVPEDVVAGLAALGGFGLSVPAAYGGGAGGTADDLLAMVVATEELSRASLAIGGSLVTRPEILTRALLAGGTEEQRRRWLPRIARGDAMVAVSVTEPDFGSDVAGITTRASRVDDGWVLHGVKTWATFAGRADLLMLLARSDPDHSLGHRGLSLFVVEKPPAPGHAFTVDDGRGGRLEGRAIPTIGYRGLHSFELVFTDWFVPADALVGGDDGAGRGFYLQMAGFENGRLQTAARAVGLMEAAFAAAHTYARQRVVFGRPVGEFPLTRAKLARMAATIQGARQFVYAVAREMGAGGDALGASMVKALVCRQAEWVTREAMQLHGATGYAEESDVSRYFVDARVLSIFEGADETLCLRVIARRLAERALSSSRPSASSPPAPRG